jgi:hypothetical protein
LRDELITHPHKIDKIIVHNTIQATNQKQSIMSNNGIRTPHEHDVLSGRGNKAHYHRGNRTFRDLVSEHKMGYAKCPKQEKSAFVEGYIVSKIGALSPPGRFLKQDPVTELWYEIGMKNSLNKTRQALREGIPELMTKMESKNNTTTTSPSATTTTTTCSWNNPTITDSQMQSYTCLLVEENLHSYGDESMKTSFIRSFSFPSLSSFPHVSGDLFISNESMKTSFKSDFDDLNISMKTSFILDFDDLNDSISNTISEMMR